MSKKITALTTISTIDRTQDVLPIVDVSDTTEAPSGTTKKITLNQITASVAKTGVAIVFTEDAIYGTIDTPETGNITASYTGAVPGTVVLILHQTGSEPTYPAQFTKMSGSGDYDTSKVNRIWCIYLDDNTVDYSISNPQ